MGTSGPPFPTLPCGIDVMQVIGVGVGRTGTHSLKTALDQLGFGPCHHMEKVLQDGARQVPLWQQALAGAPDWSAIYQGFSSAVDWPTAAFYRELFQQYPSAHYILTLRTPKSWAESFSATIQKLLAHRDKAPPEMQPWLTMAADALIRSGFTPSMNQAELEQAFVTHQKAVQDLIPAEQLLVYEVRQGWEPLCEFLKVAVPAEAFPRTNQRAEFWELVPVRVDS